MESKRIDLKEMREMLGKRKAGAERKTNLFLESLSRENYCELLDSLPISYILKLKNIREDIDGDWERTILDGQTAWQKGDRILLNQDLFPFKKEVIRTIEGRERNFFKKYYLKHDSSIGLWTKGEIAQNITKGILQELYCKQNKSLGDIGNEFGCTRQYVFKLMKIYGIERKTQSKAMIEAIKKGKFERFEYHKFNENFFSKWSPEMGWALGLLFTDGHIHGNMIQFTSVDKILLEKVRTLFQSSRPIYKRTQSYDKTKHIYAFTFSHPKTGEDLKKLGLHERKSLDMVFPVIPEEYIRHFIRGCWDGDGSIFFEEHKLIASYISGSKIFIERLVEELYKIGIYKKTPPYEKGRKHILLPIEHKIWAKYPNGRFLPIPLIPATHSDP